MSYHGFSDNTVTGTVKNDGFWPDLDTGVFQDRYRLPAEYQQAMVEEHIRLAAIWANRELREWKTEQAALGYSALEEVPGDMMGDESEYQILYLRAVHCHAKALLMKQFATVNRRESANNEGKESEETEDKFMEYAIHAIADFQHLPRIGVHAL